MAVELPEIFEVACRAFLRDNKRIPGTKPGKGRSLKICEACGKEFVGGSRAKYCEGCRKAMIGKDVRIKHKEPLPPVEPADPHEYARKQIAETTRVHDAALLKNQGVEDLFKGSE
jgi:hypothetical protein